MLSRVCPHFPLWTDSSGWQIFLTNICPCFNTRLLFNVKVKRASSEVIFILSGWLVSSVVHLRLNDYLVR